MGKSDKQKDNSSKKIEALYIKTKKLKAAVARICKGEFKEIQADNATITNLTSQTINSDTINIKGKNILDYIGSTKVIVTPTLYDCMDCDTNEPIKPDNIDVDVWNFLTENRNAFLQQTHDDLLQGRNDIRCIKQAYGCAPDCPPDCPIPEGCTTTECPTYPDNCGPVPPECIPDPETCDLDVPIKLYRTMTVPYYSLTKISDNKTQTYFPINLSYDLDVTNVTCNLATRTITILFHYAYKEQVTPRPLPPPIPPCTPCGEAPPPFECLVTDEGKNINCGVIRYNCKQFYYTVNIQIGENYSDVINIPYSIITEMLSVAVNPLPETDINGAFQLAIFVEDGLSIRDNTKNRGEESKGDGTTTRTSTDFGSCQENQPIDENGNKCYYWECTEWDSVCCFMPGTKIIMADKTTKNVEDVKAGEYVLSYDEKLETLVNSKVLASGPDQYDHYYIVEFNDNSQIKVTENHPFYLLDKGWASIDPESTKNKHKSSVDVVQMQIGDNVKTTTGYKKIIGWLRVSGDFKVYNLYNVENTHTFFAENCLVHNKCVKEGSLVNIDEVTLKKVEEIKVGDTILGGEVLRVYKKEMLEPINGKVLENGQIVTHNHIIEHKGKLLKAEETDLPDTIITGAVYDIETTSGYYYIDGVKSKCN